MQILSINAFNFRNFSSLGADFSPQINVFCGRNATGKTSLLELLFVLCLGRSHRGAPDSVLVRRGADTYRLDGTIGSSTGPARVAVAYQMGGRRQVTIDRIPVKTAELYTRFCAVSSGPEDSNILSGPPSVRRALVDAYLSQISGRYLVNLVDYQKVLAQKNAALKRNLDAAAFEPLLITLGCEITKARSSFLASLGGLASKHYCEIANGEKLCMRYKPSVPISGDNPQDSAITGAFSDALDLFRGRERATRTALVGPHRDDVYFEINGLPARAYGSQGQYRTAAISLKLGIYDLIRERRRLAPVLLFDEIFAELDSRRALSLIESFESVSQLFLTMAGSPPAELMERSRTFEIRDGKLEDRS